MGWNRAVDHVDRRLDQRPAQVTRARGPRRSDPREVIVCRRCPGSSVWREQVAREKVARYRDETYWGRPVPGFGDPDARILIVGLAPAAHGGNRTGRVFTGDAVGRLPVGGAPRSRPGRPAGRAVGADDGLTLRGVRIARAVRCAPPANKPTIDERDACRAVPRPGAGATSSEVRVIVALGRSAGTPCSVRSPTGHPIPRRPTEVRARGRGRGRTVHGPRLVPPIATERVYTSVDGTDAGGGPPTRTGAGGSRDRRGLSDRTTCCWRLSPMPSSDRCPPLAEKGARAR